MNSMGFSRSVSVYQALGLEKTPPWKGEMLLCCIDHGLDPRGISWTALTCLPLCHGVSLCLSKLLCKGERPFPCRDSDPVSYLYSSSESGTEEIDKTLALTSAWYSYGAQQLSFSLGHTMQTRLTRDLMGCRYSCRGHYHTHTPARPHCHNPCSTVAFSTQQKPSTKQQ